MATLLRADGTSTHINAPDVLDVLDGNQHSFTKLLEETVAGHIEFVWVLHDDRRVCMVVNDIGALEPEKYPMNVQASILYFANTMRTERMPMHTAFRNLGYIHGDVVLLDGVDVR